MAYCTKCGKQSPDSAKFCSGCGEVLKSVRKPKAWKRVYIIILVSLAVTIGGYFLFFYTQMRKKGSPIIATYDSTRVENFENKKTYGNESPSSLNTAYQSIKIPQPLVPIVKAANVTPQWTEKEDVTGNHALIRLYVGAIGKKTIKLFITGVDTVNKLASGYSIAGNNSVMFEGYYTVHNREASTNQANNYIDAPETIYKLALFEPESINVNGVFQLKIHLSDLVGGFGTGSWTSYDGKLYREIRLDDTVAVQMKN